MIIIKTHQHANNSGFGNKLLLSCFAESHALETEQPVFNWLVTDILDGGKRDGLLLENNQDLEWRHLPDIVPSGLDAYEWLDKQSSPFPSKVAIVGRNTNLSRHSYHQNDSDISLIKKHKKSLVKDFGRREGTFVHVRAGDTLENMVPGIEYYKKCLMYPSSITGYVSSDSPNHDTVKFLLDNFDLKLYENDPENTIIFGSTFDNKVLSLGTFSWWIGFLGNQNNVICPNPQNYATWHGPIFESMEQWRTCDVNEWRFFP